MPGELMLYDPWRLSPEHEFFSQFDFWDRLSFVTYSAPNSIQPALFEKDIDFVQAVMAGDIEAAHQALCDRYEATGRKIEDGTAGGTGDYIGPATLEQCLEFAYYWGIDDVRLPEMQRTCDLLSFIHGYENPLAGEMVAIQRAYDEIYYGKQMPLFE